MAKKVIKKGNAYLYTYIKKEQRDAFAKVAEKKGTTLSALMRVVLEAYLKKELRLKDAYSNA